VTVYNQNNKKMPKLYIYPKKADSFHFKLGSAKVSLGRSADNEIPLPDPFCSGKHAFVYNKDKEYFIRDNNSKNGIFLNGKKIKGETQLQKGDSLLLGSTRLVFDQKLATNVEVTDAPSSSANINTIMHLKDILKKPEISTTIRGEAKPIDLEELKSQHQDISIINEVTKALILHKPLTELLDHIMQLISEYLPMDRGILMLQDGQPPQLIPKVVRINNKSLVNQTIHVSQSIINMVVEKHSAVLISDTLADTRFKAQESILKLNIHSAMCVPLWNNRDIIGIIYTDRTSLPKPFSQADLRLLTLMSNLAAVKIENARAIEISMEIQKMEKELQLASNIQKDLLPKINPSSEIFDIAGANIPCQQVGGDYYDFIQIEPGHLGITIADVSGKGVASSLLMASLRAALHSELHSGYGLEKMAGKLNSFVHRTTNINSFITFFFCDLDENTGELSYINAGHNPPIILTKKGKIKHLESSGLCLGMFPDTQYESRAITLAPGDILLLFTDGFTESRNKDNQDYQETGLLKALKTNKDKPAQELLDTLYSELDKFCEGTDPMDDRTLVVVKQTS